LGEAFPLGVDFDKYGFPIFDPYIIKHPDTDQLLVVQIRVSGNGSDMIKAERTLFEMGLNPNFDPTIRGTRLDHQLGGIWHHLQDAKTMQLIVREVHENIGHTGGEAMLKHLLNYVFNKR